MAVAIPTAMRHRWALGGCVVLALALRVPWATVPLGNDEGGVAWVAAQWDDGSGSLYGGAWLDRPPLLVLLYRLAVVGGAIGVRALGALAAVAIVLAAYVLARRLRDERSGVLAALLAALLTGAGALEAAFSPAELPAAAFAAWSVVALVHERFALAGVLAACALLTKQSFVDAGLVGLVVVLATRRAAPVARYAAGAAVPAAVVLLWLAVAGLSIRDLYDALLGFRFDALESLQGGTLPLRTRLGRLEEPTVQSGLIVLLPLAAYGLWRTRPLLLVWPAAGLAGVLLGGSYWPHYLIQVIAPAAVGAAVVVAPPRARVVVVVAVAGLVAFGTARTLPLARDSVTRAADEDIAAFIKDRAEPGDTFYALYARANLNYATGLTAPYPYAWSLMVRARPDAEPRLRALLASEQRPTWIVRWQRTSRWGLDADRTIARLLRTHYREVASFAGKPVLRRRP